MWEGKGIGQFNLILSHSKGKEKLLSEFFQVESHALKI